MDEKEVKNLMKQIRDGDGNCYKEYRNLRNIDVDKLKQLGEELNGYKALHETKSEIGVLIAVFTIIVSVFAALANLSMIIMDNLESDPQAVLNILSFFPDVFILLLLGFAVVFSVLFIKEKKENAWKRIREEIEVYLESTGNN